MAFTVTTYDSPDELAAAITATVTVHSSEQELSDALALATNPTAVTTGSTSYFTLIDDAQIVNVSLRIVGKGLKYTVILETA